MARIPAGTEATLVTMPDAVDLIRFEKNLLQIGFFGAHERRGGSTETEKKSRSLPSSVRPTLLASLPPQTATSTWLS
jgi:hypothetical protein